MIRMPLMSYKILFAALMGLALSLPAMAEKPDGHNGQGKGSKSSEKHDGKNRSSGKESGNDTNVNISFGDHDRTVIKNYYAEEVRHGSCPPGLAKKHNGCMPPGQAKKWKKGYPLPKDVVYYELPHSVVVQLTPPPIGHKYVRVAADILLIAVGSSMVVDALGDLRSM
jgi:Ni/Co efflux regulator RcnB